MKKIVLAIAAVIFVGGGVATILIARGSQTGIVMECLSVRHSGNVGEMSGKNTGGQGPSRECGASRILILWPNTRSPTHGTPCPSMPDFHRGSRQITLAYTTPK